MSRSLRKLTVRKNENYVKSGIKSYASLLNKYSLTPPQHSVFYREELDKATKATAVRDIAHQRFLYPGQKPVGRLMKKVADGGRHTTTEDVQADSEYLTEVEINGQKQPFQLDFDSGSSDLWILSKKLTTTFPTASQNHNLFDTSPSTGFTPIDGASFDINYGDGSYAKGSPGSVGTADLLLGGLTIRAQAVEAADDVDQSFISGAGDGLLGLAWGAINTVVPQRVLTPVENMIAQDDIKPGEELFTAKLGSWRDANDPDHGESFYTFGFIDPDTLSTAGVTEQDIWYAPLVHNNDDGLDGFWRFASSSIVVNGKPFQRPDGNTAIADTGTTMALLGDVALGKIYAAIPGARISQSQQNGGMWVYPASTTLAQLPVVSIDVGGKQFVVQKEDLGYVGADEDGEQYILGSLQSRGPDNDFDILGDAFLKNIYAIFDQGFVQEDGSNGRFGAVQRTSGQQNINVPQ